MLYATLARSIKQLLNKYLNRPDVSGQCLLRAVSNTTSGKNIGTVGTLLKYPALVTLYDMHAPY